MREKGSIYTACRSSGRPNPLPPTACATGWELRPISRSPNGPNRRPTTGSHRDGAFLACEDALIQVGHSDNLLRQLLDELPSYCPVQHRRFMEDLSVQSTLREFVSGADNAELKAAFDACLEQSARFRTRHLEYAA